MTYNEEPVGWGRGLKNRACFSQRSLNFLTSTGSLECQQNRRFLEGIRDNFLKYTQGGPKGDNFLCYSMTREKGLGMCEPATGGVGGLQGVREESNREQIVNFRESY